MLWMVPPTPFVELQRNYVLTSRKRKKFANQTRNMMAALKARVGWFRSLKAGLSEEKLILMPCLRTFSNVLF